MTLHNPVETELRVRFAETDAQHIAYHANYIVWFEVGRTAFLEAYGLSRDRLRALRFRFVMAEVQCRYLLPAYFDDRLIVRTALQNLGRRSFTLRYEIVRAESGELLATGSSAQVAVNKEGKAIEIMPAVRSALEQER